jgi:hypothetical protein
MDDSKKHPLEEVETVREDLSNIPDARSSSVAAFLSPITYVGCAVACLLAIAALEVANHLSNVRQGLIPVDDDYLYLWTYGPVLGLFTRPDHRCATPSL